MPSHHWKSTTQALYQVFVLPNIRVRTTASRSRLSQYPNQLSGLSLLENRHFSATSTSFAKPREPVKRAEKWDNEITAKVIYVVDPETGLLPPEPQTRFHILHRLDRETHRLVQLPNAEHEGIPICKIVNKKEAYQQERRKKEDAKERKKIDAASKSLKTLELNWAMDPNDLGHKMGRMTEFLSEGRRVEIILASKKKGRKATMEECDTVLQRIRKTADGVDGAKEMKEMEGKVGGFVTLLFQGKVQQQQQQQQTTQNFG